MLRSHAQSLHDRTRNGKLHTRSYHTAFLLALLHTLCPVREIHSLVPVTCQQAQNCFPRESIQGTKQQRHALRTHYQIVTLGKLIENK